MAKTPHFVKCEALVKHARRFDGLSAQKCHVGNNFDKELGVLSGNRSLCGDSVIWKVRVFLFSLK